MTQWNADVLGEPVLRQSGGFEELLEQHLARLDGWELRRHDHLLVVVHDLDVVGVAGLPAEAEPPLAVDADGVLTLPVALESFESIAGRGPAGLRAARRHRTSAACAGQLCSARETTT